MNAILYLISIAALASTCFHVNAQSAREAFLRSERGTQYIWRQKRDLPGPRSDFALAKYDAQNIVYLVGGCAGENFPDCNLVSNGIWKYNPVTDEYTDMPPLQQPRYRHGAVVLGEELIVFGGLTTGDNFPGTIEVINLRTGQTTVHPAGIIGTISDATYFLYGGKAYLAGGYNITMVVDEETGEMFPDYVAQSAIYQYGGGSTWTKVADLHMRRGDAFSTVVDGNAYIVGGWTDANGWETALDSMEIFNFATKQVTMDNSDKLVPGRGDAAFCSIRARLFVFGGENPSGDALDEVEVLSLDYRSAESADWHYAGELPTERFRFGCAQLSMNSIHLFGGQVEHPNGTISATRVDEFVEVRIFENLEQRLQTPLFVTGVYNAAPWMWTAAHTVEAMARAPVRISYRSMENHRVQSEFAVISPRDDLYIGDGPLPKQVYDHIKSLGHAILQIPLTITAIRIVHNLETKVKVQMDACTLARVFSGRELFWNEIAGEGVVDIPVTAVRHLANSTLTQVFVTYLQQACPSEFDLNGFNQLQEQTGRAPYLYTDGVITYTAWAHLLPGMTYNEVALKNADGNYTDANSADLRLSFPPELNNLSADLSTLNFLNRPGELAYPIVVPIFAYVRMDQTFNAQTGPLLKAFLRYVLSGQGQAMGVDFGNAQLTPYVHDVSLAAANSIRIAGDAIEYQWDETGTESDFALMSGRMDRVSYDTYALKATQKELETLLQKVMDNADLGAQNSVGNTTASGVAVAALVIAIFGFGIALYAAIKAAKQAPVASSVEGLGAGAKFNKNNAPHQPGNGIGEYNMQVV